jgi:type I restriction enzyme S subunit
MTKFNNVPINSFLKEREDRFKPEEANKKGLKRIEKIDFSGNIHLINGKDTHTGMILVKKGDLLISGINVEKGAIAVYTGGEDVLATIHYSSYKIDKTKIDVDYFKWFLKSQTFKDIVNANIGCGIKTELKPKKFLPLIIPLPDLVNQIEIRKKIDSIENEIKELELLNYKNEDYIKKLRQTIFQEAVSGKLISQDPNDEPVSELLKKIIFEKEKLIREKKIRKEKPILSITQDEIPYQLPKGWKWVRLGEVCDKIGSGSTPRGGKEVYKASGIKFIRSQNVYNEGLFFENVAYIDNATHSKMSGTKVLPNDILLNITGGSIGRCALVSSDFDEANVSQHVTIIRLKKGLINKFIHLIILSPFFQDRIMIVQTGGNREGLAKKNMQLMLIPLPPLAEQKRIVEKVDQLMKLCYELEQKVRENQKNSELLIDVVLRGVFEN